MAVLSEVVDGVTPITETHPEEKRAAIGTTWDSASDLTLKQVSDGLTAEHSSAGAHSAGVIDQAEVDFTSAGNQNGEAVRFEEFNAEHNASDGTHKTSVAFITAQAQVNLSAAASTGGDAVRYNEFTQEHAAGGGHSANIIDQNEVNLTTAADQSGEAVRYDEFTQEHSGAGAHGNDIIDQAQMALTAAGASTGEATRYDEFSVQHNAATGAHATSGWLTNDMVNAAANIAGTKVAAGNEATRGTVELATDGETSSGVVVQGHDARLFRKVIYADLSAGVASGSEAAALSEYAYDDPADDSEIKLRTVYLHGLDGGSTLSLVCESQITADPSPNYCRLYLQVTPDGISFESNYTTITSYGSYSKSTVDVDVSGLSTGTLYEVRVTLAWTGSPTSGETAKLRRILIYAAK